MSLKRNILANYTSQLYVTAIGIVMVPFYLNYMGAEAYGLVGFYAMLQAWFNLLDMGLTPTMARETARFSGGATDVLSYRRLVQALQILFLIIALIGGSALFASAGVIARDWLNAQELPLSEVRFAVQAMAVTVALRWMGGLYRGAISGSERLVWLSSYNIALATLRFVGVLLVLMFIGTTPTVFFTYQLLVAVIELLGLAAKAYHILPLASTDQRLGWSLAPIMPVLKFSLTIAFTSSVWVLVTQTDKLILSTLLSLTDYGYFTLAVLVASGVMITTGPISGALTPRMARLEAHGDHAGLILLYRNATQLVCAIALPVAFTLAAFSEQVVWAWTGDPIAAKIAAPILQLYALGNGVLAVAAFPYYLQYAKGDLHLHLIGNIVFVILLIPALIWATWQYGGVGAGWAWFVANLLFFFGWIPHVHRRFAPGLHSHWLARDVIPIVIGAGLGALSASAFAYQTANRWHAILFAIAMGFVALILASLASQMLRTRIWHLMRRLG